jgi:hypothetical protein
VKGDPRSEVKTNGDFGRRDCSIYSARRHQLEA